MLLLVLSCWFRTTIYDGLTSYKPINTQEAIGLTNLDLKTQMDHYIENNPTLDIRPLMVHCANITAENLSFSSSSGSTSVNSLALTKKTHCVGYASFANSLIQYAIKKLDMEEAFISSQQRGKIYILGIEITNRLNLSFFKDHDYIQVIDVEKNDTIMLDPVLYDYFRIGCLN